LSFDNDSDADLARRTLEGQEGAFKALVARHKKWLYHFIARYVNNEADRQDILQESFVSSYFGLASFDSSRSFANWLRTIALNKCRDHGRRQTLRRFLLPWNGAAYETSIPDPAADIVEDIIKREELIGLHRAIMVLPQSLRDALILTSLEGLSYAEAAEILGTTAKGVEGLTYRARKRLAEKLSLEDCLQRSHLPQVDVRTAEYKRKRIVGRRQSC
jgi:RNA polymerase sigma-70 factor (ECF subfamily)